MGNGSGPTKIADWQPMSGRDNQGGGDATKKVDPPGFGAPPGTPGGSGGQGTVIGGVNPPPGAQPGAQTPGGQPRPSESGAQDFMSDPVTGWLVIVKGPGRGKSLRLGVGMNSIGRSAENRVVVDFGDKQISREQHCIVTFEPKRSVFYIQNSGGTNLTYVGDTVILEARPLHNGEMIQIGETELRFVSFCGEDFSWNDAAE